MPDWAQSNHGEVVSYRLRQVLDAVGVSNIEYYPITTRHHSLQQESQTFYSLAVVCGATAAVVQVQNQPSEPRRWRVRKLDTSKLRAILYGLEHSEYKVQRALTAPCEGFVVTSEVKLACEANGITGIDFSPIPTWQRAPMADNANDIAAKSPQAMWHRAMLYLDGGAREPDLDEALRCVDHIFIGDWERPDLGWGCYGYYHRHHHPSFFAYVDAMTKGFDHKWRQAISHAKQIPSATLRDRLCPHLDRRLADARYRASDSFADYLAAEATRTLWDDPDSATSEDNRNYRRARELPEAMVQQAIKLVGRAIEDVPNEPHGYLFRGRSYAILGKHERAAQDYETALALAPTFLEARCGLGRCLSALGRNDAAVEHMQAVFSDRDHYYPRQVIRVGHDYLEELLIANQFGEARDVLHILSETRYLAALDAEDFCSQLLLKGCVEVVTEAEYSTTFTMLADNTEHAPDDWDMQRLESWRTTLAPKDADKLASLFSLFDGP